MKIKKIHTKRRIIAINLISWYSKELPNISRLAIKCYYPSISLREINLERY
jgi:hypothetical protein